MKILVISIGTRGDMEPFVAIGEMLRENGHQVICAFPEQFRNMAEDCHLEFASLGTDYIETLEGDLGRAAMGGSGSEFRKFVANVRLARKQTNINKALTRRQHEIIEAENPDRVVYNGQVMYPIIWELQNRRRSILISPVPYVHYVRGHTHLVFHSNFGPFFNKLTYSLADFGLVTTAMITKRWLNLPQKITRKQIRNVLSTRKAIYTISPLLFPRPDYWEENIQILGYHERHHHSRWHPDKDLEDFLGKHARILFITFGSMTNPDPEEKTRILINILQRNRIPAIINTASEGLIQPGNFDTGLIRFVSDIPYDWLFPRVYGIIHHGGAGTTHLGLRYGCATMIIPHIVDQFIWNDLIYDMGAGPKGIRIGRMSTKNLEPRILDLVNNPAFKQKARQIARYMARENFRGEIYKSIIGE